MSLSLHTLEEAIEGALSLSATVTTGHNADYIPYLRNIDPSLRSVAIVTTDGLSVSGGDDATEFATESISKVFTAAGAMSQVGIEQFINSVGSEPTGLGFNSVMALELHGDKPLSPLVNAGALVTTSMLISDDPHHGFATVKQWQERFAGQELDFSQRLYASEEKTNARNRAIAWLLASAEMLSTDPDLTVDVYTQGCSTMVTTPLLATMAATLAAAGTNPLTGTTVIEPPIAEAILAEMMMEGLYEESGRWAVTAGVPAKSGVSGAIMAVVPGVAGIAAYAPALNQAGNSEAAMAAVQHIVHTLGWGLFRLYPTSPTPR